MDKIRVFWSKSMTIDKAINKKEKDHEYLYSIFGKSKLLYIGMTQGYIGNRLSRHEILDEILDDYSERQIRIKFGNVIAPSFGRITRKLIQDVEAVLINYHDPPYNTQNTSTYWGRDVQITNQGTYRPLKKVIRYFGEECEHEDWEKKIQKPNNIQTTFMDQ